MSKQLRDSRRATELTLLAADGEEFVRTILSYSRCSNNGVIAICTMTMSGFFVEESFNYLRQRTQLFTEKPALFEQFGASVKKMRARIKLFDDTDGGADALVGVLDLARRRSLESFNKPHTGLRRFVRALQPDLGAFFVGQDIVATSHTALLAFGMVAGDLAEPASLDLEELGARVRHLSVEMGRYAAILSNLLQPAGISLNLKPNLPEVPELETGDADFIGSNFYHLFAELTGLRDPRFAEALVMIVANVHSAVHIYPRFIGSAANLLFRLRYLTVFHCRSALMSCAPHLLVDSEFAAADLELLQSRAVRNMCAHYGLGKVDEPVLAAKDPFGKALEQASGARRDYLNGLVHRWLALTSSSFQQLVPRSSLTPALAPFEKARAWLDRHRSPQRRA